MELRKLAIDSIGYVRRLLNRFEKVLNGGQDTFSDLEINDLMDILGLENYEIKELLNN